MNTKVLWVLLSISVIGSLGALVYSLALLP